MAAIVPVRFFQHKRSFLQRIVQWNCEIAVPGSE